MSYNGYDWKRILNQTLTENDLFKAFFGLLLSVCLRYDDKAVTLFLFKPVKYALSK